MLEYLQMKAYYDWDLISVGEGEKSINTNRSWVAT